MTQQALFEHRPALDGLRAVAVYLVIAFHAGSTAFGGGFVGVDLFFVLSGFLITSILVREHESVGHIRVLRFYARRLRRLLPAALLAMAGASIALTLVSSQLARSTWIGDAQSAVLYASNWHFIRESQDYFAEGVGQTPFLHFWSLSIEEQFYAAFPIVLIGLLAMAKKWPRLAPAVGISLLATISVTLQIVWAYSNPTRAYFGTDTRLYQIALGALVSFACRTRGFGEKGSLKVLTPLGLIALFGASTNLLSMTPSLRGVVAALAAASLIVGLEAHPRSFVGRALAIRPVQFLGRISYGTYLWHWPVIVGLTAVFAASPSVALAVSAAVGTAMAALSYELLEKPVRRSSWLLRHDGMTVLAGGVLTVLAAAVIVPSILRNDAKPLEVVTAQLPSLELESARLGANAQAPVPSNFDRGNNHGVPGVPERELMHCESGPASDCVVHESPGPTVLLIGDSHAIRLVPAFLQLARDHDFKLSISTVASCRWQLGLAPRTFGRKSVTRCATTFTNDCSPTSSQTW